MVIKRLNLVNFRNYSKVNLELGPSMNIFIGENASGKTNILESIVVLALTKSYKNINENNLIRLAKKKTKIKGTVKNDKSLKNLEIEIMETEKVVKVNNKRIYCLADYISNLNIVLFTPDDLELIKGSPSIRRNLLNMELSQLSSLYLNTYNQYNKILRTRNEYLKILFTNNIADKKYLDILTEQLIDKAIVIYKLRNEYLEKFKEYKTAYRTKWNRAKANNNEQKYLDDIQSFISDMKPFNKLLKEDKLSKEEYLKILNKRKKEIIS